MGGDRQPGFIEKPDEEIRNIALKEITETLGQRKEQNKRPGAAGQREELRETGEAAGQREGLRETGEAAGHRKGMTGAETVLQPDHLEIFRYPNAIPQYEASTEQRLEAIEEIEAAYPGIHLAGNIRDGIGMADRVKQGYQLAMDILKGA